MEVFIRLPKDIQYLINDYLKDPTNYKIVITQFNSLIIASMEWMYRPNLETVIKFMLIQRKKDIITRNNIWYEQIKKLKKPHGKRPPTIRNRHHIIRPRRRIINGSYQNFLSEIQELTHKFTISLLDQNGHFNKRITRKNRIC